MAAESTGGSGACEDAVSAATGRSRQNRSAWSKPRDVSRLATDGCAGGDGDVSTRGPRTAGRRDFRQSQPGAVARLRWTATDLEVLQDSVWRVASEPIVEKLFSRRLTC